MLYIDDIIVFGSTEEEFLKNLEKVLAILKDFRITSNPDKCSFGLEEIEYVGHTISASGIHFSRSKLDSVLNFPKPVNQRRKKRPKLPEVNYFRDHVESSSMKTRPLEAMVTPY